MNIESEEESINLPFINAVDVAYFYIVSLFLLSSLLILFSSSYLMSLRIRVYYKKYYNQANDKDYFVLTVKQTIFRVAPIAWMLKNRDIFHINRKKSSDLWRKYELAIYAMLKLLIFFVAYVFPIYVLFLIVLKSGIFNFSNDINMVFRMLLICLPTISLITVAIVCWNDIHRLSKQFKKRIRQIKNLKNRRSDTP